MSHLKVKDQAPISTTTKKLIDDVHGPKEWQAELRLSPKCIFYQVVLVCQKIEPDLGVYLYDSKHLPDMKTQRLEYL